MQVTTSTVGLTHQDGYSWRKYGQKPIVNAKHPREYYRCGHKDQGCKATKQVQIVSDNPTQYKIIYLGKHTCRCRPIDASTFDISDCIELDSMNMLIFNDSDKPAVYSRQDLINEIALLNVPRKMKSTLTSREKEERLKTKEVVYLTTHPDASPPKVNKTCEQKQGDAGSASTEAISKEKQKEVATEETSSVEELQGDTNFPTIEDINLLKENTPTSSDQVFPSSSQDAVKDLSLGSDVIRCPPFDRLEQPRIPLQGTRDRDERGFLNNYLQRFMSDIDKDIVQPEGKKRKVESAVLSLTENYIRTMKTVAQLMEEDEPSTSNQLVEELEAKVELLKKRAEDAEARLEKEQAAWQRAKERYERRVVDSENEISNLEKKLDEAWTEKAEMKASVAGATKQMRLKCLDLMKRALSEYDNQVSWNHVLRQFLYLEQQSDKDKHTPETEANKGKNKENVVNKEKDGSFREAEGTASTPEYSMNTLTMTRLAL